MPKHSLYALLASLINYHPFYLLSTILKLKGSFGGWDRRKIPGDLSRPQAVETKMESVEPVLPRAGYPTVPECRGFMCVGPT